MSVGQDTISGITYLVELTALDKIGDGCAGCLSYTPFSPYNVQQKILYDQLELLINCSIRVFDKSIPDVVHCSSNIAIRVESVSVELGIELGIRRKIAINA